MFLCFAWQMRAFTDLTTLAGRSSPTPRLQVNWGPDWGRGPPGLAGTIHMAQAETVHVR